MCYIAFVRLQIQCNHLPVPISPRFSWITARCPQLNMVVNNYYQCKVACGRRCRHCTGGPYSHGNTEDSDDSSNGGGGDGDDHPFDCHNSKGGKGKDGKDGKDLKGNSKGGKGSCGTKGSGTNLGSGSGEGSGVLGGGRGKGGGGGFLGVPTPMFFDENGYPLYADPRCRTPDLPPSGCPSRPSGTASGLPPGPPNSGPVVVVETAPVTAPVTPR